MLWNSVQRSQRCMQLPELMAQKQPTLFSGKHSCHLTDCHLLAQLSRTSPQCNFLSSSLRKTVHHDDVPGEHFVHQSNTMHHLHTDACNPEHRVCPQSVRLHTQSLQRGYCWLQASWSLQNVKATDLKLLTTISQLSLVAIFSFFLIQTPICLKEEFICLSVNVSGHYAHISAYVTLKYNIPHSDSGKAFACFLTQASFPNSCSYDKTNSSNTSTVPISPVLAVSHYHASTSWSQQQVPITQWSAHRANMLHIEGLNLTYPAPPFFFSHFDTGEAGYLLLV